MADVVFAQVVSPIAAIAGGCGIRSVTCMGNGRMLAIVEEVHASDPYPQRIFRSEDNGATWSELDPYESTHNLWLWKARATGLDTVLVGNEGPDQCGPASGDDGIARTTDGGETWTKATEDDLIEYDCTETFDIMDFVSLDDDEILAVGIFGPFGNANQLLRSTNGGELFATSTAQQIATNAQIQTGAYLGNDIVVVGGLLVSGANRNARVYRSTDRGENWTEIVLPNTQHAAQAASTTGSVNAIRHLGDGVVLAGGNQAQAAGYFPPKLWRSDDYGATWAEITDSLPDWDTSETVPVTDIVAYSDGRAVVGISGQPEELGDSNWRLSEDGGVTWTTCTVSAYPQAGNVALNIRHMAIADDGAVLAVLAHTGISGLGEIWRGVPTFDVAGPCAAFEEDSAVGALGRPAHAVCIPSFIPEPCPPECPPATSLTVSTPPAVATEAGFSAPLFLFGLMVGGGTGTLTTPTPPCVSSFVPDPCEEASV